MRRKQEAVLCFESSDKGLPKVVREYRARFRTIGQVLDANGKILSAAHADLRKLSDGDDQGREGDYTSENILRALIVQHMEGLPFRDTVNARLPRVVEVLLEYESLVNGAKDYGDAYREVLEEQPWKKCPCDICKRIGIHVMLFRGAERNRRRGFHNVHVLYRRLRRELARV